MSSSSPAGIGRERRGGLAGRLVIERRDVEAVGGAIANALEAL